MSWVSQSSFVLKSDAEDVLHFTSTGFSIPVVHQYQSQEMGSVGTVPIAASIIEAVGLPASVTSASGVLVTRRVYYNIVEDCKKMSKDAAEKLIYELEARFPSSELVDAFGIVYPQYWLAADADDNFVRHLSVIKDHYGQVKKYALMQLEKKTTILEYDSKEEDCRDNERDVDGVQARSKEVARKQALPMLSVQKLDKQASMFKIAMHGNCEPAMQGDNPINSLRRLWRRIEANNLLRHKLSEYMKISEISVATVYMRSVED
ncbi:hypothetical protein KC19_VG086600 [Ceratodon purpureus]|uniref:Uncharacterized protein n=1 Tax=Ceratodon purpureus TaxID=3225 RepID=A0A8T0HN68_CERPU|nr:hypothetical protein KC19_VG086600 [Ceratodon purpureus]